MDTPKGSTSKNMLPTQAKPTTQQLTRRASMWTSLFAKMSTDSTFDRMRPTLIYGMLFFKESLDVEKVRTLIKERLLVYPRFRSVLKTDSSARNFEEVYFEEQDADSLPIDELVKLAPEENAPYDQSKLDEFMSDMYANSMDPNLPLWRIFLFNNLPDGRNMFTLIVDHTIADGITLIEVLFSVLDDPVANKVPNAKVAKRAAPPSVSIFVKGWAVIKGSLLGVFGAAMPNDPANCLKLKDHRNPAPSKKSCFTDVIPLDKIKEMKDKCEGATVNDILMALMTLTMKKYAQEQKDPVVNKTIRGSFLVSTRGNKSITEVFGNHFAMAKFPFDFRCKSGIDCISRVQQASDFAKNSPEPFVALKVLKKVLPFVPKTQAQDLIFDSFAACTCTVSNVPGPMTAIRFAGQEVDSINFLAFTPVGLYVGVLTYNGQVAASISVDPTVMEDPNELAKFWKPSFDELYEEMMKVPGKIPRKSPKGPMVGCMACTVGLLALLGICLH